MEEAAISKDEIVNVAGCEDRYPTQAAVRAGEDTERALWGQRGESFRCG